jgi:hypothetical protein
MSRNSVCARRLAHGSSRDGIGLDSAPSLPQSCDMVDIDIETLLL